VIGEFDLQDFIDFEDPTGAPQIGLGRGGITGYAAWRRTRNPKA
jgi:hypothetical protein